MVIFKLFFKYCIVIGYLRRNDGVILVDYSNNYCLLCFVGY